MTDTSDQQIKQSLGVGNIVGESFGLLFGNVIAVTIAAFVPILIGVLISGALIGFSVTLGVANPTFTGTSSILTFVVSSISQLLIYGIMIAVLVQLAYDAKIGRAFDYKRYASSAIATLFPNLVLMFVVTLLASIGMIFLVIPGLWIYAVYYVVIPAIVIERVGFGAMRRSQSLTKGYRWPILGAFILILICSILLSMAALFLIGLIVSALGTLGVIVGVILYALFYAVYGGLMAIAVALIYARLREIKEGIGVDILVGVFE